MRAMLQRLAVVSAVLSAVYTSNTMLVRSQSVGGFTQPYDGNQPWTSEPVPQYVGWAPGYAVTRFSSVRLAGLPLDDAAALTLGVYLPLDEDGAPAAAAARACWQLWHGCRACILLSSRP